MFFVIFNHANACASIHSLVKIHNTQGKTTSFTDLDVDLLKFILISINAKHFIKIRVMLKIG